MFTMEVLEKIFIDKEMQTIPIGCQSTAIHVIERVLEECEKNGTPIFDRRNDI